MKRLKKPLICFGVWVAFWTAAYVFRFIEYGIEYAFNYTLNLFTPTSLPILSMEIGLGEYCLSGLLISILLVPIAVSAWEIWEERQQEQKEQWEAKQEEKE